MIRVGVNLMWMVPGMVGGTEDGVVSLLEALADARDRGSLPDVEVVLFGLEGLSSAHPALLSRFEHHLVRIEGRNRAVRVAAETLWLPVQLRRRRIDVVHHAGGIVPAAARIASRAAIVVTVHDIQVLEMPEHFSALKRRYLTAMLPRSVRAADLVVAATAHAAEKMVARLGLDRERLRVVHFVRKPPAAPATTAERLAVRARYELAGPFLLYPAITYPHKNHLFLIDAFAGVVGTGEPGDRLEPAPVLVLCGGEAGEEAAVRERIVRLGIAGSVRRTGRIPRRDLDILLTEAAALVFPSRYEGFGLPVLEAMAAGCPVISSDAGALPEVAGEAAVLVPPDDTHEWTAAMREILHDPALRRELHERGLRRAANPLFSPEVAVEQLSRAYRDAARLRAGGGRP